MPAVAPRRRDNGNRQRIAVPPIPFTAAAHEHVEPVITAPAQLIGAAQVAQGPYDVPSYGFLRHIVLEVTGTAGVLGAGVLSADYPFNVLQNIFLTDVNGAPIMGPLDGWALLQANIYGGYANRSDARQAPNYVGTINFSFILRIPVEVSRHNGYGSLANQNAAAAYRVGWTVNSNTVYSTQPTTAATVTVKAHLEAWSQPNERDLTGRPQFQEPPGHGTTQFWSSFTRATVAGQNNIILPRVGNMIRSVIVIARAASLARADNVMADPLQMNWDARLKTQESQVYSIARTAEALEQGSTRDTGVFVFPFNNILGGKVGDEEPNLWLPTVQSTRLSIDGVAAAAGTWQILTCDVAPVEVRPEERYVEDSATGFRPVQGGVPQGV